MIGEPEGGLASFGPALSDVLVVDLGGKSQQAQRAAAGELDGLVPVVYLAEAGSTAALGDGGAQGWLSRDVSCEVLAAAVRAVAAGVLVLDPAFAHSATRVPAAGEPADSDPTAAADARLTTREHEVLTLLAVGMTNKAIARTLAISEHTVKFHAVRCSPSSVRARARKPSPPPPTAGCSPSSDSRATAQRL